MTDGNTHAIAQHLDKREDWDALQEVTVELEQAEARIEELERAVRYEADIAQQALDSRKELQAKLATCRKYRDAYAECDRISTHALRKAVEALEKLADCVDDGCFCSEMEMATAMDNVRTTLAELSSVSCANLKGETDAE